MATANQEKYYVPHGSHWPIVGSLGLFSLAIGSAMALNNAAGGALLAYLGAATIICMLFGWFGTVIHESVNNFYNAQVDRSFRQGMIWFIASEVFFFAAFFGALLYARQMSLPWLSGEANNLFTNLLLWPGFENAWPSNGPGVVGGEFEAMAGTGLPAINTLILLTSGVTVTIAHHALKHGQRQLLNLTLAATVALGFIFVALQISEYKEAYGHMNLTLGSGIYGSTFYMLTGFHGLHVTLGAIMLLVVLLRCFKGHFSAENHFAFEAAAWYWHFVDVVWLGLYVFVYWL
ncbi:MAG: cytochrome c oxidase subunit 3 [Pseudomonadota bacterium]